MRYFVIVLFSLLAVSLKPVTAQEISLSYVVTNPLESNRGRGGYPEVQMAVPVVVMNSGESELLLAVHWGTWLDEYEGFRCADVCPDATYRARLFGVRVIYSRSSGRAHARLIGGIADLFGHERGGHTEFKTLFEAGASFGVDVLTRVQLFVAISRYQPVSRSNQLAIGKYVIQGGWNVSF